MAERRGRRGRKGGRPPRPTTPTVEWTPKTRLGKMVKAGEIKTISDALHSGLPLREPEIVDLLIPEMEDEVIDVNMVQRMTDSGRRVKFVITVAVGNQDGYVGFGQAKGKEVGSSIRKAIENAKMNMIEIRRGCGSWECGCKKAHTIPFAVTGKTGSVEVTLKPAPQGIGLATGDVAKKILTLAGVKDCWAFTRGKTKTTVNYAKAVFDALMENTEARVRDHEVRHISIKTGSLGVKPEKAPSMDEQSPVESKEKPKEEKPKEKKDETEKPKEQKEEKEEKPAEKPDEKTEEVKEEPKEEKPDKPSKEETSEPEKPEEKPEEPAEKSDEKPTEEKPVEKPKDEKKETKKNDKEAE